MRGFGRGGGGRNFQFRGDTTKVYELDPEDASKLKAKYPPLMKPDRAFARLSKKQKAANDLLDIDAIENEVIKCLNESTTRRLYVGSDQDPSRKFGHLRNKFVSHP